MLSLSACLEAGRVPGELEDPEDASDPEDLDDAADVVEAAGGGVGLDEEDGDEVGQDGEHVDHVHPAADELPLLGGTWQERTDKFIEATRHLFENVLISKIISKINYLRGRNAIKCNASTGLC